VSAAHVAAFAKINLCLFLGPVREDGRHQLVTLFESVSLSDELTITPRAEGSDEVICPGVRGRNLARDALAALRSAGWDAPPVRVEIEKRIPVAAGMGGGSADAAAVLRHAPRLAPVSSEDLARIASALGADVPSQLDPGPSLGTGAGEVIQGLPALPEHAVVVVPQPFGVSTAEVYGEADRLGLPRSADELGRRRAELEAALAAVARIPPEKSLPPDTSLPPEKSLPADNDLQAAALSLRPELARALEATLDAGADQALVCGSGPTVIGVCWGSDASRRASRAAERMSSGWPRAIAVEVVNRGSRLT
jgi:4-diphosphocytidyl-2-C-methyl-D-erythritol kinase